MSHAQHPDSAGRPRLASVLLLCWRDTGHPQGGGSEVYLQRIGARLAAEGVRVTLRTARYRGAPRREVLDGVTVSRAGGRYSVYPLALLALLVARLGRGPLRGVRPDVVIDSQNGLAFFARLVSPAPVVMLVHHCHRDQWPVAGPVLSRIGWFAESVLSPWVHRGLQYVTVSLPSARDLIDLGVRRDHVAVVRNGVDPLPAEPTAESHTAGSDSAGPDERPTVVVLSRLVPHKQIEHAITAVARLREAVPGLRLDVVGDGWWRPNLVRLARRLGVADAVAFHGHVDDAAKHRLLDRAWVQLLPSRKEGWALSVIEAAQHGVPTIGYRSAGGLTDSIVDGVTGLLARDPADLEARLRQLLGDPALRAELGAKARVRSAEFSWAHSADAMRTVLESVLAGRRVSGLR